MACDRFGFRITAIIGTVITALGLILTSFVTMFPLMYVTYSIIAGLGYGFLYNSSLLVVLAYFVKRRSIAVGIFTSASSAGLLVVSQSNAALLREFGWRTTFRIMAAVMALSFIGSLTFRPISEEQSPEKEKMVESERYKEKSNELEAAKETSDQPETDKNATKYSLISDNLFHSTKELSGNGDSNKNSECVQNHNRSKTIPLFKNKRFVVFTCSAALACFMYFNFLVHMVS